MIFWNWMWFSAGINCLVNSLTWDGALVNLHSSSGGGCSSFRRKIGAPQAPIRCWFYLNEYELIIKANRLFGVLSHSFVFSQSEFIVCSLVEASYLNPETDGVIASWLSAFLKFKLKPRDLWDDQRPLKFAFFCWDHNRLFLKVWMVPEVSSKH